jgi:hypothetical protein
MSDKINWLVDIERFTIYEYTDICTIPKLYIRDRKLFELIIKKYDIERTFSLVNLNLLKRNYKGLKIFLNEVVVKGNLDCIKWLLKYKSWDERTFANAVRSENLENMKWLKENNCPCDEQTFRDAARFGNLEIMKWLKTNNCPWDETVFIWAADLGNLDNMKWLKEQNCPWDEQAFARAAYDGNLENMKWLKDQNCPWNIMTAICAVQNGNLENMKWLR